MKTYSDHNPGPITDLGDGSYFINENIIEYIDEETGKTMFEYDAILRRPPSKIYVWKFRTYLILNGLKATFESVINDLDEPHKTIANEVFQFGVFISRNWAPIAAFAAELGLTDIQMDDIFIEADEYSA